jgi:hypothetical protein
MKLLLLVCFIGCSSLTEADQPQSRLDLSLQQRLGKPQLVAAASVRLTDFLGFIATSFKVPLLVEATSPVPDLKILAGTYSARQLLDIGVRQLHGYKWTDDGGVAHIYQTELVKSAGNLLSVRIHRFSFPHDVAEFLIPFRSCISSTINRYDCMMGGVFQGIQPLDLKREPLPYLELFKDVSAREILLRALEANGHFYVLIAFESTEPKLASKFPYRNWFSASLVPAEPSPMWVQTPTGKQWQK